MDDSSRKRRRSTSPTGVLQTSDVTSPPQSANDVISPPPSRRRMASSPGVPLFSSPPTHVPTSEIDLSSPLNFGTPSSRIMGTPGGSRGTPIRPRGDIGHSRRVREVNLNAADPPSGDPSSVAVTSDAAPEAHLVIWGTDVNVQETKKNFRKFLENFVDDLPGDGGDSPNAGDKIEPYYMQRLDEINMLEEPFLNVNCDHLLRMNSDLYSQLIRYPQEVIPTFDLATNELFGKLYPDTVLTHQIQVRTYNVEKTKNMRSLNPEDIDQLITISGMVIRTSPLIPEMREAFFRCYVCKDTKSVEIDRGRIAEPAVCSNCQTLHSMALMHNHSLFTDKQMIKLQESPDDMPPGQTPHTVILYAHHDLVDAVQPGDRVAVTGIYRAMPLRVMRQQRSVKAVYRTYIDVIHFRKADLRKLRERDEEEEEEDGPHRTFSAERIEQLKQLSRAPDIYDRLARALAPSIYENDDIKKGILLQLFGGSRKDFHNTGHGRFRADINILLCGDPGTSKSQLLQYVHNLMPRGQYTSGKGSSAVGLTAYVTRDPETRQLVLQTGALVLSDNGICCIDEFDKMNDSTRAILHEVMEQQTLSIAKAGIICSLNARTSILAAANPRMSQWDEKLTVVENIQLPHTLLSRFDLIFLMLDPQDEQFDRRLATHLVSLYHQSKEDKESVYMDMSTLRDYIAYARSYIQPTLSEEAGQALVQAYVDMRKIGSSRGAVTAYPRQLESLIRLSEAHAKMRFSNTVEIVDVEEAKRLHREALKQSATDPKTGIIDVGILTTGVSSSERSRRQLLARELHKLLQTKAKTSRQLKTSAMLEQMQGQSQVPVTQAQFDAALRILRDEDLITVMGQTIRLCQ